MTSAAPTSPLLDLREAAGYVRMHHKTLGKHALGGRCESVQHSPGGPRYFTVAMLDRFIDRQTQRAKAPKPRVVSAGNRALPATPESPWRETGSIAS